MNHSDTKSHSSTFRILKSFVRGLFRAFIPFESRESDSSKIIKSSGFEDEIKRNVIENTMDRQRQRFVNSFGLYKQERIHPGCHHCDELFNGYREAWDVQQVEIDLLKKELLKVKENLHVVLTNCQKSRLEEKSSDLIIMELEIQIKNIKSKIQEN